MKKRFGRRQFLKTVGTGALAVGLASSLSPLRVSGQPPTLRILHWRHFVPPYDEWFNNTFAPKWGAKNGVNVVVENVGLAEIPAIGAAEAARVAAGADPGHDMIQFNSPPATLEPQAIDHTDLIQQAKNQSGNYIQLAQLSTFNPRTGKSFGFSDNFVPDPIHYRSDLWSQAAAELSGFDRAPSAGPVTWDDIRRVGKVLKKNGNPVGLGLSQEIDTNMWLRSLLYSFGTSEQDEESNVIMDVSPFRERTLEALRFAKALYEEAMFDAIFAWTAASNNEEFLAGRISVAANAISITRTAQARAAGKPESDPAVQLARNTAITDRAPAGPMAARGLEHVMGVYLIWNTGNTAVIDKAKQMLLDLVASYDPDVATESGWGPGKFQASQAYDYPTFEDAISKEKRLAYLNDDPISKAAGDRPNKLAAIETAFDWAHNVGWPGPSNAATDEIFNATFTIPNMFATVARGLVSPEEALDTAAAELRSVFQKWRDKGLVGGTR